MRKGLKVSLIICGVVFGVGIILAGLGFALGGFHSVAWTGHGFKVIDGAEFSSDIESVDETFTGVSSIVIDANALKSVHIESGNEFHVTGSNYTAFGGLRAVQEGSTLRIEPSTKQFFAGLNWGFLLNDTLSRGSVTLTVSGDVVLDTFIIDADASSITGSGINTNKLIVDLDAGDAELIGFTSAYTELSVDAGSLKISNGGLGDVKASVDAGSIRIADCSFLGIYGDVNAGDIKLASCDCSGAVFDIDAGDVTIDGYFVGKYKVDVNAGSFNMKNTLPRDSASVRLRLDFSSAYIDGRKVGGASSSLEASREEMAAFDISGDAATIRLDFLKD